MLLKADYLAALTEDTPIQGQLSEPSALPINLGFVRGLHGPDFSCRAQPELISLLPAGRKNQLSFVGLVHWKKSPFTCRPGPVRWKNHPAFAVPARIKPRQTSTTFFEILCMKS